MVVPTGPESGLSTRMGLFHEYLLGGSTCYQIIILVPTQPVFEANRVKPKVFFIVKCVFLLRQRKAGL